MKAISLFSGVGGMDLGLHRAGFEHVAFCEADPYRREVLRRHWPGVPVHDDVRTFEYDGQVDLLAGGFPCQDLSVAGKRAGLAGERSGLFYDYARIADRVVRPGGFLLVENVPGLLSSNSGRDMAIVVRTLADLGFASIAYRTLDSQYFHVPQRRRRVFIVACRSESDISEEVLALTEGGEGDSQESEQERKESAGGAGAGSSSVGIELGEYTPPLSPTVTAKWRKGGGPAGDEVQNLVSQRVLRQPATTTAEPTGSR